MKMKIKITTLVLSFAALCCPLTSCKTYAEGTNSSPVTNVTNTTTNRVTAAAVAESPVPMTLSSLRFVVGNQFVMGADIAADKLLFDVPGSARKLCSYTLDPTQYYVVETKVTIEGGILQTKRQLPVTGVTDMSPNLPRNKFTGEYDSYTVFLVASPLVPPRVPGEETKP
jgi:hypothetical protein